MTAYTQETLIPSTTYGTPSGNYDGNNPDFIGNAVIGANYYGGMRSAQTVIADLADVVGTITIQGTLHSTVLEANWFDIITIGDPLNPLTDVISETLVGNFVWLRAVVVGFENGTINSVGVNY